MGEGGLKKFVADRPQHDAGKRLLHAGVSSFLILKDLAAARLVPSPQPSIVYSITYLIHTSHLFTKPVPLYTSKHLEVTSAA